MGYAQTLRRRTGRMPQVPARKTGTWKLAYADFLTALVAFFLVMWLVKGLPQSDRGELATYFETGQEVHAATQTDTVDQTTDALADVIRQSRVLMDTQGSIRVSATDHTVKIDLMDRSSRPIFKTGGSDFTKSGSMVISRMAEIAASGDWPVGLEGHTDAFASRVSGTDNWDLSSARANAFRRALINAGLPESRIISVTGLADSQPINPGEPHLSANRRVTLVLHVTP
ncbi:MAG: flagellar motor protein MotB [Pseudomonadota bacterium]